MKLYQNQSEVVDHETLLQYIHKYQKTVTKRKWWRFSAVMSGTDFVFQMCAVAAVTAIWYVWLTCWPHAPAGLQDQYAATHLCGWLLNVPGRHNLLPEPLASVVRRRTNNPLVGVRGSRIVDWE